MGRAQKLEAAAEQLRVMWLALEDAYPMAELVTADCEELQRLNAVHAAISQVASASQSLRAAAQEVAVTFPLKIKAPAGAIENLRICETPLGDGLLDADGQLLPIARDADGATLDAARTVWCCSQLKTRIVIRDAADLAAVCRSAYYWADFAATSQFSEFPSRQACGGLFKIHWAAKQLRRQLLYSQAAAQEVASGCAG